MKHVFLSYRRSDSGGYTRSIHDRLVYLFSKKQIFMDVDDILLGADFVEIIENNLQDCEALLVIIGPQWLDCRDNDGKRRLDNPDDFVRLEIVTALENNIRVIPILVNAATMPAEDVLPDVLKPLARRQALTVSNEGFAYHLERLASVLSKFLEPKKNHSDEKLNTQKSQQQIEDQSRAFSEMLETVEKKRHQAIIIIGIVVITLVFLVSFYFWDHIEQKNNEALADYLVSIKEKEIDLSEPQDFTDRASDLNQTVLDKQNSLTETEDDPALENDDDQNPPPRRVYEDNSSHDYFDENPLAPHRQYDDENPPLRRYDGENPPPRRHDGENRPSRRHNGENPPPRRHNGENPPPRHHDGENRPPRRHDGENPPPRRDYEDEY